MRGRNSISLDKTCTRWPVTAPSLRGQPGFSGFICPAAAWGPVRCSCGGPPSSRPGLSGPLFAARAGGHPRSHCPGKHLCAPPGSGSPASRPRHACSTAPWVWRRRVCRTPPPPASAWVATESGSSHCRRTRSSDCRRRRFPWAGWAGWRRQWGWATRRVAVRNKGWGRSRSRVGCRGASGTGGCRAEWRWGQQRHYAFLSLQLEAWRREEAMG